ncbi:hypothetical protein LAU_0367 [Lausannevirus]|uniref:F-box containing protein n=1 Tax=Lausannevirus TaxID=999883 RepID=F2WLU4_9VIRU|nr:hypothetical protein LAU_0367 [Lausannevirus]AEA07217.1 hypothetical protein LAU_0367 [Lausannevirus]
MESSLFLSVIPAEMMLCIFQKLERGRDFANTSLACSVFYGVIRENKDRLTILAPFEKVFHQRAPKDVQAIHGVPRKRDRAFGFCTMLLNKKFHGKTWAKYGHKQKFSCVFSNNTLEGPFEYTEDCQGVQERTRGAFANGKRSGRWDCGMSHEYGQTCVIIYKNGNTAMYQSFGCISVFEGSKNVKYLSIDSTEMFKCPNNGLERPVFRKNKKEYAHCCKEHQGEMPDFLLEVQNK